MKGEFSLPLLHNTIGIMTPVLLAAIGGMMTELAGMLNIALEGLILIGAFFSVIFSAATGSLALGIILGVLVTMFTAWIFGLVSLKLKANIFITGLAVNLLAAGVTTIVSFHIFGTKGVLAFDSLPRLPVFNAGVLNGIPFVGDILFGHNILVYAGWLTVVLSWMLVYRTPYGFRLRGTGSNPSVMKAIGIKPSRYKISAVVLSGLTCGLAGAVLTLNIGAYVPNISSGRGWIALVVIYLGGKKPFGILLAAFVFGFAESLSNYAQGFLDIPADFILAFPYIITVAAMIIMSAVRRKRT